MAAGRFFMEHNDEQQLWQGGPWEQPAPVFPAPPPVHIPAPDRRSSRPTLRTRHRGRKWPWLLGLTLLVLSFCAVTIFLDLYFSPSGSFLNPRPYFEEEHRQEETQTSSQPPSISQAETGTGVTLTLNQSHGQALSLSQVRDKAIVSLVSIEAFSDSFFSSGSGVIFTQDGYLLTNAHVVAGASDVRVQLNDNRIFPASLVGFDAQEDLAVLKIDVEGLTPAEFGDSNALVCGEAVSALGDSLGYRGTFTDGIISALDREMKMEDGSTMVLIQTSAAINFGNSGGPLLNQYGQVVGINTIKIISNDGSAESLGFAIPSARVKYVVDELIAGNEVRTAAFGFTVSIVHLPDGGLELLDVDPSSDAYAKGLRPEDVLLSANGISITSTEDLVRLKQSLGPGDTVELTYLRDGAAHTVAVALMDAELFS